MNLKSSLNFCFKCLFVGIVYLITKKKTKIMTLKKYIYELLNLIVFLTLTCIGILIIALISIGICFLIYHKVIWIAVMVVWNIVFLLSTPFIMPCAEKARNFTQEKLSFLNK
jgi:hypothetical protein